MSVRGPGGGKPYAEPITDWAPLWAVLLRGHFSSVLYADPKPETWVLITYTQRDGQAQVSWQGEDPLPALLAGH
jgi:hypothetical protein